MSLVALIRHAHSEANKNGILAGRTPGVGLSSDGMSQSHGLVTRLGVFDVKEIRTSPIERCVQTITPWKDSFPRRIRFVEDSDLQEVDYGKWTGRKISALSRLKAWETVQKKPSEMVFPDGEGLLAMQARAMKAIHRGLKSKGTGVLVVVSHGDVIKAILSSALGQPFDEFQRIVIDPASVTVIDFGGNKPRVLHMNDSQSHFEKTLTRSHSHRLLVGGGSGK
ncbi:unannotated protein [freshwater metagenome]|uniref:Unannotated protein n=1 Tax=freshwater metagenome TaxID=449393 RepID=A0A6J7XVD8_9ZZZZ|nr:MSMEG_4193 family putative phosphomutase [Actinomycetota bacterium]